MIRQQPEQLHEKIFLIDGFDCKMKERTGTYVLAEEQLTLIETSASPSVPYIMKGLEQLQYRLEDIKNIIVTHIHLDHAGGAGLLIEKCPNATVFVHPKGARHLADPSRLIAGARAVYKDQFDDFFDPIVAIPEERLVVKNHGDQLEISENCTLTFYDTPGHANHHLSIYHSGANGMFTGDTAGVRYPELARDGIEFCLPSTSPNQFDPDKTLESIQLYESLHLERIFFGHYGMSTNPPLIYEQLRTWMPIFVEEAEAAFAQYADLNDQIAETSKRLTKKVTEHLSHLGVPKDHEVYKIISLDISVCSMGLIDYLHKSTNA